MKHAVSFLLALIILSSFSACSRLQAPPVTTESTQTTASSTDTTAESTVPVNTSPPEPPSISVSMPIVRETLQADDGTEIFSYVYQNMSLILPEPETADKIIVDYLNRIDKTSADAEAIKAVAKADYHSGIQTPYLCRITYNPVRIDRGVLSLFGNYTTYSGSAHPTSADISINYDLVTGDVIRLEKIMAANAAETLISEVIESLNKQKENNDLFDNFAEIAKDRFANGLSHEDSWYFSDTGLCFYFSEYDIAPYSSGVIIAEIPYEKLAGLMDDAYFPSEPETITGTLSAAHFNEDQLEKYDNFSEVIIDKGFIKALLYTDSTVYDLQIDVGTWSDEGDIFIPEYTVYAANLLTSDDAIMVESEIPDALPRLRITYRTGDQTVSLYLADSGEDGSILLIEE